MQKFSTSPRALIKSFWINRSLIKTLSRREVLGRYQGSLFGLLWSFFNPVLMLVVYTFVFSAVFKARWHAGSDSKTEFALLLFAGLLVFNLFADCIGRAPGLIAGNVNYVKKVIFPLEILPVVNLIAALFHFVVSLFVWLVAYILIFGVPHLSVLMLPLILIPFLLLILGFSWALSAVSVFLEDTSQLVGVLITVLMFLSPIFYPASSLPIQYQELFMFNPLTPVIEMTRDALFTGSFPNFTVLSFYLVASLFLSWLGFYLFQVMRKEFADVL